MLLRSTLIGLVGLFLFLPDSFAQLKTLKPKLGAIPDIGSNAAANFQKKKELYLEVSEKVRQYGGFEEAAKHLSKAEIELYENGENDFDKDHWSVGKTGCSWYCGGGPDSIYASSQLAPDGDLNYVPDNAHDFSLRTAWAEGAAGNGIGQSITYRFAAGGPPVTIVEIHNGYMKTEKTWSDNARIKKLKLYINNKPYATLLLSDTKAMQRFTLGGEHQGRKKPLLLRFEIAEVYPGAKYQDAALAEIQFDGTGVHCFAAGTLVTMADGSQKPIESVKPGDRVLSFNEKKQRLEAATVSATAAQQHHNLYEYLFESGSLTATDDHPFFTGAAMLALQPDHTRSRYAVNAGQLMAGQLVLNRAGRMEKLIRVRALRRCEMTYTITRLSANRVFFANGIGVGVEPVKPSQE